MSKEKENGGEIEEVKEERHQSSVKYATNILHKIHLKLSGKENENEEKMNLHQQIERLIQQATSVDNLSMLYEGFSFFFCLF